MKKRIFTIGFAAVLLVLAAGAGALYAYDSDHSGRPSGWFRKSGGTSPTFVSGTSALATGTWTHLALTFDGSSLRLFSNGIQVALTLGLSQNVVQQVKGDLGADVVVVLGTDFPK